MKQISESLAEHTYQTDMFTMEEEESGVISAEEWGQHQNSYKEGDMNEQHKEDLTIIDIGSQRRRNTERLEDYNDALSCCNIQHNHQLLLGSS